MRSVAALVAIGATVAVATPAVADRPAPSLRLAQNQPLVLSGALFAGGERVTVTVHARRPYLRRVVANPDGSFSVSFGVVRFTRCGGLIAEAAGSAGDRAMLRIPRQACATPPATD